MKIAILTSVHPPLDGRIFYKQALSLAKSGHNVTYLAPYDPQATVVASQHNITYIPLKVTNNDRTARLQRWFQIAQLLRNRHFDAWHIHDPELLPLTIIWKSVFARNTHLLYDVHEDLPKNIMDKLWIPARLRWWTAWIAEAIEGWGATKCSAVIAATESIEQRLHKVTNKTVIIHNYPIIESNTRQIRQFFSEKPLSEIDLRVVYVGGLTPSRGIKEIVQAMTFLTDKIISLVLLGDFWPESFEQDIRHIAGSNVEIVGKIPFTEVARFLTNCDIGIVCLQPTPAYVESLPIKLFEYMQAALPVVASDFPIWRRIIKEANCGLLVNPTEPQQIASAIRILASDRDLRIRMGQSGQTAVYEHYTWQAEERILLDVYARLTSKTP